MNKHPVFVTVNGTRYDRAVEPRLTLADFLRDELRLTGTNLGCEQGVCGSCTVLVNGKTVRSCLMLAVQANGAEITTVEGLAKDGALSPLQKAFWEHHAVQCGYCTSGLLVTCHALLRENPDPDEEEIREYLSGNICRCTGYQNIVRAVKAAAASRA